MAPLSSFSLVGVASWAQGLAQQEEGRRLGRRRRRRRQQARHLFCCLSFSYLGIRCTQRKSSSLSSRDDLFISIRGIRMHHRRTDPAAAPPMLHSNRKNKNGVGGGDASWVSGRIIASSSSTDF